MSSKSVITYLSALTPCNRNRISLRKPIFFFTWHTTCLHFWTFLSDIWLSYCNKVWGWWQVLYPGLVHSSLSYRVVILFYTSFNNWRSHVIKIEEQEKSSGDWKLYLCLKSLKIVPVGYKRGPYNAREGGVRSSSQDCNCNWNNINFQLHLEYLDW